MSRKLLQGIAIGAIASAIALSLWQFTTVIDRYEGTPWVWRVTHLGRASDSTDKIKLILLDQASLDWASKEMALPWPWPRQVYVPIIDFCLRGGAKAIAFDVLYTEPSAVGVEDDEMLGAAVAKSSNFVAAVFLGKQATQALSWPDWLKRPATVLGGDNVWARDPEPGAAFPIPEIATNAAILASVKDTPDVNGLFTRATLFRTFDGVTIPSLGLAAYLAGAGSDVRLSSQGDRFTLNDASIPVDAQGRTILRFRGPSGTHQTFSAAGVIQSEVRLQEGGEPTIDPSVFKDCYVLFGFSAPGLKDLRPTPISGDYPGVEIHATLLDNLLERDAMRDAKPVVVSVVTTALCLVASLLVVFSRSAWQNVVAFAVLLPLPLAIGYVAYGAGIWWQVTVGTVGVAISLVSGVVLNYATEGRQKRFIKSAFKQYLGESVIDEIIADPSKLRLGGEKRELTMFFSDLEKFSSFSERLDPPALIDLLNKYLSVMGEVIIAEGGYLDKFIGDAIVAFWNAPANQADHALRAVRAAIICQRRLAEKQPEFSGLAGAPVRMRIGLNTGDVVVGNMGSADRFNYTMLGDAANLASRLEGVNKAFGTFMLISESTWEQAKSGVQGRWLGAVRVVGRKDDVEVYEPMALAGEQFPSWTQDFEKGVKLCREQKWADALAIFERFKDDPPSQKYAARCRELLAGSLKEWDGVWSMTEK